MLGMAPKTWNVGSLFGGMGTTGRNLAVRRRNVEHLCMLGRSADVLLLPEVCGVASGLGELHGYVLDSTVFTSFGRSAHSGAVAIGVSRRFQSLYVGLDLEVIRGRIVLLHCRGRGFALRICCAHLVREAGVPPPVRQPEEMRRVVGAYDDGHVVLGGD